MSLLLVSGGLLLASAVVWAAVRGGAAGGFTLWFCVFSGCVWMLSHAPLAACAFAGAFTGYLGSVILLMVGEKAWNWQHVAMIYAGAVAGATAVSYASAYAGARFFGAVIGFIAGALVMVQVLKRVTAPPDVEPGHCAKCGYDLRGLPENRCPECGTPFIPSDALHRDPHGRW